AASGPLRRTTPMAPRPGGVAMATMVSDVENMKLRFLQISLSQRDHHRLRKRVADALGGDARHLGDRHVNEAALVRVEWPELLIQTGLLGLFREELRHPPQLDVLALPVLERVDEDAPYVGKRSVERHADD